MGVGRFHSGTLAFAGMTEQAMGELGRKFSELSNRELLECALPLDRLRMKQLVARVLIRARIKEGSLKYLEAYEFYSACQASEAKLKWLED